MTVASVHKRLTDFTFAKAILDMESFQPHEFEKVGEFSLADKNMLYVHLKDFTTFTESYILDKAPYTDVPESGEGILSLTDIRDIESHNMFPVEFKGHDAKHVHFTTGHPLSAAMLWTSARSKNHLRYMLMGGLFEGVDTV